MNVPLRNIFSSLVSVHFEFSSWEHCNCTNGRTARKTMDNPLGNTARTFFGNISSVSKVFLMGTLWLHHQDHLKCTENSLPLENCIKIGLENLQCSCSVWSRNTAIISSISLQCTCSVPGWMREHLKSGSFHPLPRIRFQCCH